MATNNEGSKEDLPESDDSKSNRDSILLVTDSYKDLAMCLTEQVNISGSRHNSVSNGRRPRVSVETVECIHTSDSEQDTHNYTKSEPTSSISVDSNDGTNFIPKSKSNSETGSQSETNVQVADISSTTKSKGNAEASTADTDQVFEDDSIDYLHDETWKQQRKHFFVLSSAGKPIYS